MVWKMDDRSLRILTVADVPPDPDSGAAGTVYHTNVAFRELGHEVYEVWADQLGPRRIRHGNLHSLLEQPRTYRREVLKAVAKKDYDVVIMSQPQAYLAARALKKRGFGGLVINRSHGLELRANAVLPKWHRRLGVSESRGIRSLLTPVLRRLLERQWPAVARWSDGVILCCDHDRDFLMSRLAISPDKVRTIHHGIPDAYLQDDVASMGERRRKRILYVGQFSFIKGPHILAQTVNELLSGHPDCTLTWVCSARHQEEAASLISDRVRPRVSFLDWLQQGDLRRVYDDHGVFLFPSFFEGAAKAVLEAMARGLCVVATDTGGMRDYIQQKRNGFLIPAGDAHGFVDSIKRLLLLPDLSCRMAVDAAESVREYNWRWCAAKAVEFFNQLRPVTLRVENEAVEA